MRIAQVALRFDAPGGVETTVRELSKGLERAGDSVTVYASDILDEGRWERFDGFSPTVDGVRVRRFRAYKRLLPGITMPLMVGLVEALAADRPDVIHAHSHRYGHVLECAVAARSLRIPLVVSTHYHPADRREPPGKRGLLRLQDQLFGWTAYRVAGRLVVETSMEASLVAEFAPPGGIREIPPGVDLSEWDGDPQEPGVPGLPPRYLLFAGRAAPNKGLPQLVRALARIPPERRLPLVLVGRDWGARDEVDRLAKELGIGELLHWTGHIESLRDYRGTFRHASALVLPSEWEAFGLVLLEAMAARVPIVATAVGGVPEVLDGGACGRLVPYGDPDALARAITEVDGAPAATREMVERGVGRIEAFRWERAVEAHRALYRELTSAGRSSERNSSPRPSSA